MSVFIVYTLAFNRELISCTSPNVATRRSLAEGGSGPLNVSVDTPGRRRAHAEHKVPAKTALY